MKRIKTAWSTADLMACCIAREIENGDLVAQGIATPLVSAGYLLAKNTHAPDLLLLYTVGNTLALEGGIISLTNFEATTIGKSSRRVAFPEISCELLPTFKPKEFFRPAQVDGKGKFNNVVIGNYFKPRLRLPGAAGILDVTCFYPKVYLYVPRHNKKVFVKKVDFVSGLGCFLWNGNIKTGRRNPVPRPVRIITNLCILDIQNNKAILFSIHPGVCLDEVIENTGFKIEVSPNFVETQPPTERELLLLKKIDPFGIRDLECLPADGRLVKIKKIVMAERKKFKRIVV